MGQTNPPAASPAPPSPATSSVPSRFSAASILAGAAAAAVTIGAGAYAARRLARLVRERRADAAAPPPEPRPVVLHAMDVFVDETSPFYSDLSEADEMLGAEPKRVDADWRRADGEADEGAAQAASTGKEGEEEAFFAALLSAPLDGRAREAARRPSLSAMGARPCGPAAADEAERRWVERAAAELPECACRDWLAEAAEVVAAARSCSVEYADSTRRRRMLAAAFAEAHLLPARVAAAELLSPPTGGRILAARAMPGGAGFEYRVTAGVRLILPDPGTAAGRALEQRLRRHIVAADTLARYPLRWLVVQPVARYRLRGLSFFAVLEPGPGEARQLHGPAADGAGGVLLGSVVARAMTEQVAALLGRAPRRTGAREAGDAGVARAPLSARLFLAAGPAPQPLVLAWAGGYVARTTRGEVVRPELLSDTATAVACGARADADAADRRAVEPRRLARAARRAAKAVARVRGRVASSARKLRGGEEDAAADAAALDSRAAHTMAARAVLECTRDSGLGRRHLAALHGAACRLADAGGGSGGSARALARMLCVEVVARAAKRAYRRWARAAAVLEPGEGGERAQAALAARLLAALGESRALWDHVLAPGLAAKHGDAATPGGGLSRAVQALRDESLAAGSPPSDLLARATAQLFAVRFGSAEAFSAALRAARVSVSSSSSSSSSSPPPPPVRGVRRALAHEGDSHLVGVDPSDVFSPDGVAEEAGAEGDGSQRGDVPRGATRAGDGAWPGEGRFAFCGLHAGGRDPACDVLAGSVHGSGLRRHWSFVASARRVRAEFEALSRAHGATSPRTLLHRWMMYVLTALHCLPDPMPRAEERVQAIREAQARAAHGAYPAWGADYLAARLVTPNFASYARIGIRQRRRALELACDDPAAGPESPLVGRMRSGLGWTLALAGNASGAREELEAAVRILGRSFGAGHLKTVSTVLGLSNVHASVRDFVTEAVLLRRAEAVVRAAGAYRAYRHVPWRLLEATLDLGQFEQAEALLAGLRGEYAPGGEGGRLAVAGEQLLLLATTEVKIALARGQPQRARDAVGRVLLPRLEAEVAALTAWTGRWAQAAHEAARAVWRAGDDGQREALLATMLRRRESTRSLLGMSLLAPVLDDMSQLFWDMGDYDSAVRVSAELTELERPLLDTARYTDCLFRHASTLQLAGRVEDARAALLRVVDLAEGRVAGWPVSPAFSRSTLRQTVLSRAYSGLGDSARALQCMSTAAELGLAALAAGAGSEGAAGGGGGGEGGTGGGGRGAAKDDDDDDEHEDQSGEYAEWESIENEYSDADGDQWVETPEATAFALVDVVSNQQVTQENFQRLVSAGLGALKLLERATDEFVSGSDRRRAKAVMRVTDFVQALRMLQEFFVSAAGADVLGVRTARAIERLARATCVEAEAGLVRARVNLASVLSLVLGGADEALQLLRDEVGALERRPPSRARAECLHALATMLATSDAPGAGEESLQHFERARQVLADLARRRHFDEAASDAEPDAAQVGGPAGLEGLACGALRTAELRAQMVVQQAVQLAKMGRRGEASQVMRAWKREFVDAVEDGDEARILHVSGYTAAASCLASLEDWEAMRVVAAKGVQVFTRDATDPRRAAGGESGEGMSAALEALSMQQGALSRLGRPAEAAAPWQAWGRFWRETVAPDPALRENLLGMRSGAALDHLLTESYLMAAAALRVGNQRREAARVLQEAEAFLRGGGFGGGDDGGEEEDGPWNDGDDGGGDDNNGGDDHDNGGQGADLLERVVEFLAVVNEELAAAPPEADVARPA